MASCNSGWLGGAVGAAWGLVLDDMVAVGIYDGICGVEREDRGCKSLVSGQLMRAKSSST